MAEYAAYDVGDAAHPAIPVGIAGYNPGIHPQTGCMVPSAGCESGSQCVYDDCDGDGGSEGICLFRMK